MASADIEIGVAVGRDGRVASAEIQAARTLVATSRAEEAFRQVALESARLATFICRRCRQGTIPYSLVYAFRFDGVLQPLDLGYAAPSSTSLPAGTRVLVAADVPILTAALGVRANVLPPGCEAASLRLAARALPVTTNPWTGDDAQMMSLIRSRIAGHADADRPSPYELQLAGGIEQAYAASYVDGSGDSPVVYGLLFRDRDDARAFVERSNQNGSRAFVVHRQIVVAVRGASACAETLSNLLRDPAHYSRASWRIP
jgi:hypothetical protein